MKNKNTNLLLRYDCTQGNHQNVRKALEDSPDMDITYNEGECSKVAIAHDRSVVLSVLLEHYNATRLRGDHNSVEYKSAKHQLLIILRDAFDSTSPSPEVAEILSGYINTTDDNDAEETDRDADFDAFELLSDEEIAATSATSEHDDYDLLALNPLTRINSVSSSFEGGISDRAATPVENNSTPEIIGADGLS